MKGWRETQCRRTEECGKRREEGEGGRGVEGKTFRVQKKDDIFFYLTPP